MIEENQKYLNRLLILFDICSIVLSYWISWFLRFRTRLFFSYFESLPPSVYLSMLVFLLAVLLVLYSACDLYSRQYHRTRTDVANILKANAIALAIFSMLLFLIKIVHFSRGMLLTFFAIETIIMMTERLLVRAVLLKHWSSDKNTRGVVLIGYSRAAEEYIDRILRNPQWGYRIRGILDDSVKAGTEYHGIKVLGRIDNLMVILPYSNLDEIVITLGLSEYYRLENIVALCEKSGVHTKFVPDYNNIVPTKSYTEDVLGLPVINIRYVPLSNPFQGGVKRLIDIAGSLIGIAITSPVMLTVAILIKVKSPGPVLFRQERVGLHNKCFNMYKFRSMVVQDSAKEEKAWTTKDDPRVTKIGHFLRRTNLDELPQLFNILKGEMSLVGPRPERPFFVKKFSEEIPRYNIKHQVRPGLTGWAQVHGYRGDTSIKKRIDYDLYYIENWTLWLDVKIIFLTLFGKLVNKNAY